jgi:transposase
VSRDEQIIALYAGGMLIKHIAAQVGMAPNSVGQVLKRLGVERPSKPQKKVKSYNPDDAVAMWDAGWSTSAIAERMRISQRRVAGILREAGRDIASARRHRYDGHCNAIQRGGALQRMAAKA